MKVFGILGDSGKSEDVVIDAAFELPSASAQMRDDRQRSKRNDPTEPRESYCAYLNEDQLFDLLVMCGCESEELEQEQAGLHLSEMDRIKRLAKHQVKTMMRRNSFRAGISRCRILGNYTAEEFLELYEVVAPNRCLTKDEPECSRTRDSALKPIEKRFGIPWDQIVDDARDESIGASDWRVAWINRTFKRFLPSNGGFTVPRGYKWKCTDPPLLKFKQSEPHGDDVIEVKRMCIFWDIVQLNRIAGARHLQHAEKQMRRLPIFEPGKPSPEPEDDCARMPIFNQDRIRRGIARLEERRRRLARGSVTVRVDGIDKATIGELDSLCEMQLDSDASLVQIIGRDYAGEVVIASYILTYDEPKTEVWNVKLPWSDELTCTFQFDDNENVRAELTLTTTLRPELQNRVMTYHSFRLGHLDDLHEKFFQKRFDEMSFEVLVLDEHIRGRDLHREAFCQFAKAVERHFARRQFCVLVEGSDSPRLDRNDASVESLLKDFQFRERPKLGILTQLWVSGIRNPEVIDLDWQTAVIRALESVGDTQTTHDLIGVLDTDVRKDAAEILGRMGAASAISVLVRRAAVKPKNFENNPDATLTNVYVRAMERILERSRTMVALRDLRLLVELTDVEQVKYRRREEPPTVYVDKREPIDCTYLRWLAREELKRRDGDHTVLVPKGESLE